MKKTVEARRNNNTEPTPPQEPATSSDEPHQPPTPPHEPTTNSDLRHQPPTPPQEPTSSSYPPRQPPTPPQGPTTSSNPPRQPQTPPQEPTTNTHQQQQTPTTRDGTSQREARREALRKRINAERQTHKHQPSTHPSHVPYRCHFYQRGRCKGGTNCRFLHTRLHTRHNTHHNTFHRAHTTAPTTTSVSSVTRKNSINNLQDCANIINKYAYMVMPTSLCEVPKKLNIVHVVSGISGADRKLSKQLK